MDFFAFPLSAILAAIFCMGLCLIHFRWGESEAVRFLKGGMFSGMTVTLLAIAMAVEGTWKIGIPHSIAFLTLILATMSSLGLYLLSSIIGVRNCSTGFALQKKVMLAEHAGIFLILFGSFFGAPDFRSATMVLTPLEPEHVAIDDSGRKVPLPFSLELQKFTIDFYEDGSSPKQYTALINIDGGSNVWTKTASVNHPCFYRGWFIYQADYDRNAESYVVLKLVKDPWLPIIFLGMAILAAGAVMQMKSVWKSKAVLPVMAFIAVIFGCISVTKIKFGTLMPALRSFWFVPHLIIYMLAYSMLATALVLSVISERTRPLSCRLLETSSSLLILGMLCGAVWAKFAWGDCWTWDAKECWAAVTWLFTLSAAHLPVRNKKLIIALATLLAFGAMQITWYGVNSLPAANYSMHTYNKS